MTSENTSDSPEISNLIEFDEFMARLEEEERNRPWHRKVRDSIRSFGWKISRAWDRVVDTAHRPFYRITVPRKGTILEDHCLHRYCHQGSNLGTFLYMHDHYVTRDLKHLWVKDQYTLDLILKLTEAVPMRDRTEAIIQVLSEHYEGEDGELEALAEAIFQKLEGSW